MHQNGRYIGILLLVFFGGMTGLRGQDAGPETLTLDRIITDNEYRPEGFGPARWRPDGSGYVTLERSEDGKGRNLVQYDPATGGRTVIVPAARLTPPGAERPLDVADYDFSPDGERLLVFTNTQRVWRQNTRGDYWVLDLADGGTLRQLGGDGPEASLMFAKFSPDGTRVAYVREHNLHVEDLNDGCTTQLTSDGSTTTINGTFDWVYEEEFALRDGFRWSPDSTQIAYWQIDAAGVPEYTLVDTTSALYPKLTSFPYPKVGQTNPSCRVGVVAATGGETRWVDLPGDPREHYIARMDWAGNSNELVFQRLNRLQNTNAVMLAEAETGHARVILQERDEAWVDVVDDLRFLDEGRRFTWISEGDGWRHLYLVPRAGGEPRLVTPGEFDVIEVLRVDDRAGVADVIASPENPTQRYLFRVPLDSVGEVQRLTPDDQPGTHGYQISPDGRWAIHTFSTFTSAPVIDLVSLPDHKVVRTLVDNAALREKLAGLRLGEVEFLRVDIGEGVELDGWCIRPPDFDPSRTYPLLLHVYGEPAGQTVLDRWGGRNALWHQMLAQQGYLVASFDNRGTPAPRGREWRKCIYRQVGILASRDQAEAVKALRERWPYLDSDRVGIWGWSGGGSMTLNALFRYPDLYRAGIAVAPVSDMRLYDTIYQERYMGLPDDNADGYRDGSPISFADQLEGDLLVIHGTADDNVHYQSVERLVDRLIAANKPFTMMAYPNRSHGIYEGENTSRHLYELMTRFVLHSLPLE